MNEVEEIIKLEKWICIKEVTIYNIGREYILKIGEIVKVMFSTIIFFNQELSYLLDGDLETHFVKLSEWRDKQIDSILDEDSL